MSHERPTLGCITTYCVISSSTTIQSRGIFRAICTLPYSEHAVLPDKFITFPHFLESGLDAARRECCYLENLLLGFLWDITFYTHTNVRDNRFRFPNLFEPSIWLKPSVCDILCVTNVTILRFVSISDTSLVIITLWNWKLTILISKFHFLFIIHTLPERIHLYFIVKCIATDRKRTILNTPSSMFSLPGKSSTKHNFKANKILVFYNHNLLQN